jgi:parallel beta-helix repeat protein
VVTTSADAGLGSLRQALLDANQSPNVNRIIFDIGASCGPRVINLTSNLPAIVFPVTIDGYTQPGASRNTQATGSNGQICIILQQGVGSSAFVGLQVGTAGGGDTQLQVEGLGFSNFLVAGISLNAGNGHTILGSQFGGNIGAVDLAPSGYGVNLTFQAIGVQIGGPEPSDRNVFVEASETAINLSGSLGEHASEALVQNNTIGLAANGSTAQPNGKGIVVYGDKHRIVDNVISGNDDVGIDIVGNDAVDNLVQDNVFGRPAVLCFGSACNRGNGSHGVRIRDAATRNTVRYNTFAYNGGDGVAIVSARANPVLGNSFYSNDGEGIDLGDNSFTPNDNDAVAPPLGAGNANQNYPLISSAIGTEGSGTASGSLASVNGWYLVELYASNECGAFFNLSEGRYPIGRHFVQITNAPAGQNGSVTFSGVALQERGDADFFAQPRWVLATATRYSAAPEFGGRPRETSEFGVCIPYVVQTDTIFEDGFDGL